MTWPCRGHFALSSRRGCSASSRIAGWLVLALAAPAFGSSVVPSQPARHARVDLVATQGDTAFSGDLLVGIRFRIDAGWHIYWQNPGDSGAPPSVRWSLPAGLEAGPLEWPAPVRLAEPPLASYVYTGEVVLPVRIRVTGSSRQRNALTIAASVRWVVCREVCVAEQADTQLDLPIAEDSDRLLADWRAAIDSAVARIPRPWPAGWTASAALTRDGFLLAVETGRRETAGTFFPLDRGMIDDGSPQAATSLDRGVALRIRRSDQLTTLPSRLRGVFVLGPDRAYSLDATIVAPQSRGAGRPRSNNVDVDEIKGHSFASMATIDAPQSNEAVPAVRAAP
ncbi:MAG: hypothetical protein HYX75_10065 [Acidobacteria bacterium]|nr:hypothetical protein [Acidobacteriota bacterium]